MQEAPKGSKKKSKPHPQGSVQQMLENNRAKNRALKKLLKLIEGDETSDVKENARNLK